LPFWIFKKESDEEKARKAEQQTSVAALEAGDLPLIARRRLQEQVSAGSNFFTSTLSAKEYLLSKEAGYQILGPVMGSAFVRIPYQLTYPSSGELAKVTAGRREARRLAISRLAKEAEILGAHGVIGVKVTEKNKSWSGDVTEFTATGTAIRVPNSAFLQANKHIPFTSTLSGQEFWQLFEAGYWPLGVIAGNCSWYEVGSQETRRITISLFGSVSNQEVDQFSRAFINCRRIARDRLIGELAGLYGDGAVDMSIDYSLRPIHYERNNVRYVNFMCHFNGLGTAVIYRPDGMRRIQSKPLFIIDLARVSSGVVEFDEPIENLTGGGNAGGDEASNDYDNEDDE
jgi:uncharacterized protein YbjQ (UPF0145 family)